MSKLFCENLKEARLKKGITQKDVAEIIGVAKSTYSLYESGGREPSVETIKKIASFLQVSADMLLGVETDDESTTLAAHLDGDFTEEERKDIESYIEFVKTKRKEQVERLQAYQDKLK